MKQRLFYGILTAEAIACLILYGAALMAVTVSNVGFNLLQLLIADRLRVINGTVQIPLLSIVLVMAALLAAQFVKDGKELKDDNDMFI